VSQAKAIELEASILDIFASRQGEGICVGDPHMFVRFGGCNVVCDYCDTPDSIPAKSGRRYTIEGVLKRINELPLPSRERVGVRVPSSGLRPPSPEKGEGAKVVSLTGGEPLVQVGFLERLIPALRERGLKIYLETNGTLPRALERIVEGCDWIAMDLKPESAIGRDMWEAHRWFLETGGKKVFVKMVLTEATSEEEVQRAVTLIAGVRPSIPLVLQPATAWGRAKSIPLARLASLWVLATRRLSDVRILPQIHRLWEIP
jgi:7-carboxy-7-deazaguanine synthase